jgi:enoyl-CoA hydratase
MSAGTIQYHVDGPVATITLHRPDKLNALTLEMLDDLETVVVAAERNETVRAVLLTGAGRAFSVGADVNAWGGLDPLDMWRTWIRRGQRIFDRLARLRQPVVAVLNGYTFGGGLELALAADLRLAAGDVEFALPEVSLGTVPGWAGTRRLPELIGSSRAKQMILTGSRIDAETAERWGLVNGVFPRESLMVEARSLAERVAKHAPVAVQLAKQLIDAGTPCTGTVSLEAVAGALAATTDDGREGLAAFRERREARFEGR